MKGRNAVFKNIKDSEIKLTNLETNLKIYDKNKRIKKVIVGCNIEKQILDIIEE